MKRLTALALFLVASGLQSQQASQPASPLHALVDRLYAYADQYRTTLPSLSCNERIVSQEVSFNGKVKRQVRLEGTIRELRKTPPDPFDPFSEQHRIAKVNGKLVRAPGGTLDAEDLNLPFFIQGIFANLIGFHREELKDCFVYRASPVNDGRADEVQVEADRKAEPPAEACRAILAGTHYMVIADAETGRIVHSERTIPPDVSEQNGEAYFASIDYAPVQFGDRIFWLPAKSSAHDATESGEMESVYSNCHRYASEVRIVPEVPQTGKPQ
ncbi:hypothetical protein [Terracidiphilus sp.]|uniref:hypothetical protein n=1 Tax=Terracidiphilus sp. TaxID=1964191 RepID=UPI003C29BE2F